MSKFPVYLIDDDDSVRLSVGFMLKTSGLTVHAFANGTEFLRETGKLDPGAVLLDVRMPEMVGVEVQYALHACGVTFPVTVIPGPGAEGVEVEWMTGEAEN